jgi:membrane protein
VDHDGQPADNAAIAHARSGPSPPPDAATPGADASKRPKARAWRDKGAATADRIKTGPIGTFWSRLSAVEFMNSALMFAGLFLVCFFPFLAVVDAAVGRNTQKTITDRLGLNAQAAHDVDALISTGHQTVSALSVLGAIVLVLFAIGIPGVLQAWYEKVYHQPAPYSSAPSSARCGTKATSRPAPRAQTAKRS